MALTWTRSPEPHSSGEAIYIVSFNSILSFIEKYRSEIIENRLELPIPETDPGKAPFRLQFAPPAYSGLMETRARILETRDTGCSLELAPPSSRLKGIMEAYTDLCEAIWAECMELMGVQGENSIENEDLNQESKVLDEADIRDEVVPEDTSSPQSAALAPETISPPPAAKNLDKGENSPNKEAPPSAKAAETPPGKAPAATVQSQGPSTTQSESSPRAPQKKTSPPAQSKKATPPSPTVKAEAPTQARPQEAAQAVLVETPEDEVEAIQEDEAGLLAESSPPLLLGRLALQKATGRLTLTEDDKSAQIVLKKGWLVQCSVPCLERFRLGEMLVRAGDLSEERRDAALEECIKTGDLMGQVLLRSKHITQRALQRALERQAGSQLIALRTWVEGTYAFEAGKISQDRAIPRPVNPARVYFRRWVKRFAKRSPEDVANAERGFRNYFLVENSEVLRDINVLALDPDQYKLWRAVVETPTRLANAYPTSPLSRRITHGVIFAWKELGIINMCEEVPEP